jgi:hypothetical protein
MRGQPLIATLAAILVSACAREVPPTDIRAPGAVAWAISHADSAVVYTVVARTTDLPVPSNISGYPIETRGPTLSQAQLKSLWSLYRRPCAKPVATVCLFEPRFAIRFFAPQLSVDILFGLGCDDSRVGGTATLAQPKGLHAFPDCSLKDLSAFFRSVFPEAEQANIALQPAAPQVETGDSTPQHSRRRG